MNIVVDNNVDKMELLLLLNGYGYCVKFNGREFRLTNVGKVDAIAEPRNSNVVDFRMKGHAENN
jgi:hypothetical protein